MCGGRELETIADDHQAGLASTSVLRISGAFDAVPASIADVCVSGRHTRSSSRSVLPLSTALLRAGLLPASLLSATATTTRRLHVSGRTALLWCTAALQFRELRDARSIQAMLSLTRSAEPKGTQAMTILTDDFYRSSNGDRWQLVHDTVQRPPFRAARAQPGIRRAGHGHRRRGVFGPDGDQPAECRLAGAAGEAGCSGYGGVSSRLSGEREWVMTTHYRRKGRLGHCRPDHGNLFDPIDARSAQG